MLRGGLLVGAITAALLLAADRGLIGLGLEPLSRLGLLMALGAVLLPLLTLLLARAIVPTEIGDALRHLLRRFPARLQAWIGPRVIAGATGGGR
jgi:hypothetical protein